MTPVRFQEYARYDITQDRNVTLFMATTPKGCYSAEVVVDGYKAIRENRERFKERAIDLITSGADPCKVEL